AAEQNQIKCASDKMRFDGGVILFLHFSSLVEFVGVRMRGRAFYFETRRNVKIFVKNVKKFRVALLLVVTDREPNATRGRKRKFAWVATISISSPLTGCPFPDRAQPPRARTW